jgi:hypothetical protein
MILRQWLIAFLFGSVVMAQTVKSSGKFNLNGSSAAGPSVTLPQVWINNLEWIGTTTNTITFPYNASGSTSGGAWTCGSTGYGPYTYNSASTSGNMTNLQAAVNDAEACRAANGSGTTIIIHEGSLFTGLNGISWPQTTGDNSTNFIVMQSRVPLPTGRTVCSHGIQDNIPESTQIGLRNWGCNGAAITYQLGIILYNTAGTGWGAPTTGPFTLANGVATNTSAYNDLASMYTIEATNNAIDTGPPDTALPTGHGPHHFAILNAELRSTPGTAGVQAPVKTGQDTETNDSQLPNHLHFAYDYIHSDWNEAPLDSSGVATGPETGFNITPNAMAFDCIYCSVAYTYIDKMLRPGAEGHGFSLLLAKQMKLVHNWIDGTAISHLCGGFAGSITIDQFMTCSDMEDRGNKYTYPISWVTAWAQGFLPNSVYGVTGGSGNNDAAFQLIQTNGAPNHQALEQIALNKGGTGYTLNDVLTLSNPTDPDAVNGTVLVTGVSGGVITSAKIVSGSGYTVCSGGVGGCNLHTTPNTGGGSGVTVDITSVSPTGGITGVALDTGGNGYAAANNLTVIQPGASGGLLAVTTVTSTVVNGLAVAAGDGYSLNGSVQKNRHEYKFSNRIVLDGNIFENGDYSGQQGQAISFKANQASVVGGGTNYWTTQQNSTITNNISRINCAGMSGGFRSLPGVGSGGGVSDTVASYWLVNNLEYDLDIGNPGCNLSIAFAVRVASASTGTTWANSTVTRTGGIATATLNGSDAGANGQGRFHVGDPVMAYSCGDPSFDVPTHFPISTVGPPALPGTVTAGLTVVYANPGFPDPVGHPDGTSLCTIDNGQGTPDNFNAMHNSDFASSATNSAMDPSGSLLGTATHNCALATHFNWKNIISTNGGPLSGPVGEGARSLLCGFDSSTSYYHHHAIPQRDNYAQCPGHSAGVPGGIAACYKEINALHQVIAPQTLWGVSTPWCVGHDSSNPLTEDCIGIIGNMGTSSFNYILTNWHNYRLCHASDTSPSTCAGHASMFAAGGSRQADDGTDMGADFTKFDPAQVSTQYCASCGSFPDYYAGTIRTAATCAAADFNTQIAAAAEGDTVQGPPGGGTATWTTNVTFVKNVVLDGNGCAVSLSGSNIIDATTTTTANTHLEIRNFTFNGTANGKVTVRSAATRQTWLVHNNVFNGADAGMQVIGRSTGVIYRNSFTDAAALAEEISIYGASAGDYSTLQDDLVPGSGSKLTFIEGNTFTGTTSSNYAFFNTYYGGAFVARFNSFINFGIETHGSSPGTCAGEQGARWEEIYNNDHTHPNGNTVPIKIRGGSGIVFNNTSTGSQNLILTDDCTTGTWPIQGMLSLGIEPAASSSTTTADATKWNPLYAWNNPAFPAINSGNALIQIGASEFACTHTANKCDAVVTSSRTFPTTLKRCESAADVSAGCPVNYSYTPYACPHPATGLSGTCDLTTSGTPGYVH